MKNEFVPHDIALELKELGYKEGSYAGFISDGFNVFNTVVNYNTNPKFPKCYDVPTFSQAFRWFRDKYKIYIQHDAVLTGHSQGHRFMLKDSAYSSLVGTTWCETYEEAELECLKKLIDIIKEKK